MRRITVTALAMLAMAATLAGTAEAKAGKKLEATRSQVDAACTANGGAAWGTLASSGSYGCITDSKGVYCEEDGQCEDISPARLGSASRLNFTGPLAKSAN